MPEDQKPEGQPPAQARPPAAPKPPAAKVPASMATTPWDGELPRILKEQFGGQIQEFSTYLGQNFLVAQPDSVIAILEFLKLEADFDYLVDVTAVDYPQRPERFDLVYVLCPQRADPDKNAHSGRLQAANRDYRTPYGQLAGAGSL
jgi:hypothetical protein